MPRDLHHNLTFVHGIAPQSLGATAAGGKLSKIIDRAGYDAVEWAIAYGSITATNATVVAGMKDGDATNSLSNVTAALMIGTLAAAGIGATSARASGVSKNVAKSIGYAGMKRYVQLSLAPTVSGGIIASASAILSGARGGPAAAGS